MISPSAAQHSKAPAVSSGHGALLGAGGAPTGPVCVCAIWQETLTFQCHLQGLLYFIQPWLSIKDI